MKLRPMRVELKEANAFVSQVHRHHAPVTGHRFSLGVADENGKLVGVAICGRPVARAIDQKNVLEVNRVATDGTKNACSFLYSASVRCAQEMGFSLVITYTLASEPGASLRAVGWVPNELADRDTKWGTQKRPRQVTKGQDLGQKIRWEKELKSVK